MMPCLAGLVTLLTSRNTLDGPTAPNMVETVPKFLVNAVIPLPESACTNHGVANSDAPSIKFIQRSLIKFIVDEFWFTSTSTDDHSSEASMAQVIFQKQTSIRDL